MNVLIAYRNKVRDAIAAGVPGLRSVEVTAGKVTAAHLKQLSPDAPAALVAVINIGNTKLDSRGMIWGHVKLGVLVIVRDLGPKKPAEVAAWDIAVAITKLASMNQFNAAPVSPITGFEIENLMNDEMIEDGVGVIAVAWDVHMEIGRDFIEEERVAGGWTGVFPEDIDLTVNEGISTP